MVKKQKKEALQILKNAGLTALGTLILALGTAVFLVPFDLICGGMTGIAIVIDRLVPLEFFTVDLIVTVLAWLLFALGFFALGRSFALNTLVSTVVYPIAFALAMHIPSPDFLGGYFDLSGGAHSELALLLSATVGGALVGLGCAVAFLGGGSTGGTDVIALILCKAFPRLRSSRVIFITDALVVAVGMFVIGDFVLSLLGILSALVSAFVIDKVFLGGSAAFVAEIISAEYEKINADVISRLGRTTTIIDVYGGYSGERRKMLVFSFTHREYATLMSIVGDLDKLAFVTVHRAHEISGEGFTR